VDTPEAPPTKRFHRIPTTQTFTDFRLSDNSFESKSEHYGKGAQSVLGEVKGKGFRHEKTKKKRGTYSAIGITNEINSIPLSDDNSDSDV